MQGPVHHRQTQTSLQKLVKVFIFSFLIRLINKLVLVVAGLYAMTVRQHVCASMALGVCVCVHIVNLCSNLVCYNEAVVPCTDLGSTGKEWITEVDSGSLRELTDSDNDGSVLSEFSALSERERFDFSPFSRSVGITHSVSCSAIDIQRQMQTEGAAHAKDWMPNRSSSNCLVCDREFTLVRRRHHCRSWYVCAVYYTSLSILTEQTAL